MNTPTSLSEALGAPALGETLLRYARLRARMVYPSNGEHYARDLVQYAFERTWAGDRPWSPEAGPLVGHLRLIIRSKSRDDRQRARRGLPGSVDVDGKYVPAWTVDSGIEAERSRVAALEYQRQSDVVLSDLHTLAAADHEVLLLLAAYQEQVYVRKSVLELTGLTAPKYKAALSRLRRLADRLPALHTSRSRRRRA